MEKPPSRRKTASESEIHQESHQILSRLNDEGKCVSILIKVHLIRQPENMSGCKNAKHAAHECR